MIVKTTGFIRRLDFSEKLCNFNRHHHTFGKNTQVYNANVNTYLDFEVVSLVRKDDSTTAANPTIPTTRLTSIYAIVNWLFTECNGGVLTANAEATITALNTQFGDDVLVLSVDVMIPDDSGNILPNKLSLIYTENGDTEGFDFWFNSLTIESEFQESQVTVINPVPTIDDLINPKATISALIANNTIHSYNNTLNAINKVNPYTAVRAMDILWINKDNPSETLQIQFTFVCYGPVASETEILRNALREYVAVNSAVSDSVWEVVLPEIFTATAFLMIPNWDSVSSGAGTGIIYNPFVRGGKLSDIFKNNLSSFTAEHVETNFEIMPVLWQSLSIGVCSPPTNKEGFTKLSASLDDYMLVSDLIRFKPGTRDLVMQLNNVLPVVQNYKTGDVIDSALEVETIHGFNFITFTSYNIKCKIMTKVDYMSIVGE